MANLCKLLLIGNLTRDPELRVTPKGTAICQFSVAVNREYKSESGEKKSEVTFIECEAWSKTGELISKYLSKGSSAYFEARLKTDEWIDKETQKKRTKLKAVIENVQFLGSKSDSADRAPSRDSNDGDTTERHTPPPARQAPPAAGGGGAGPEEDVPFARHDGPCE